MQDYLDVLLLILRLSIVAVGVLGFALGVAVGVALG